MYRDVSGFQCSTPIGAEISGREPAIPSAMRSLQASMEVLHDVISNLESRLSPAMTNSGNIKAPDETRPPNCDIVEAIRKCHDGSDAAISRIQSILQRLEI